MSRVTGQPVENEGNRTDRNANVRKASTELVTPLLRAAHGRPGRPITPRRRPGLGQRALLGSSSAKKPRHHPHGPQPCPRPADRPGRLIARHRRLPISTRGPAPPQRIRRNPKHGDPGPHRAPARSSRLRARARARAKCPRLNPRRPEPHRPDPKTDPRGPKPEIHSPRPPPSPQAKHRRAPRQSSVPPGAQSPALPGKSTTAARSGSPASSRVHTGLAVKWLSNSSCVAKTSAGSAAPRRMRSPRRK